MKNALLKSASLFFAAVLLAGAVATAQSLPARDNNDVTLGELGRFDQFLDAHPEIARDVRKDPALINNKDFVEDHPQLGEFLKTHPGVREEARENPRAFMKDERGFEHSAFDRDRGDHDTTRAEVARFDEFLDNHPAVDRELRKNPGLVNNAEYVERHPELGEFLRNHPGVREEIRENPRAFMKRERKLERREGNSAPREEKEERMAARRQR